MNNISEQLLEAMDIITEERLRQLKYDKTIQATVYSIVDVDTGEYKVRYNGNIFSAFSEDTSKSYSIKDAVYVKVPEGNFSNKKLITSLVTAKSLSNAQLSDLTNSVFEVSPTFDALYDGAYDASQSYGVIAGTPVGEIGSSTYIFQNSEEYEQNGYHGLFQQYSNNYEYIRLKASFLTQFHNIHNQGNYGIEVEFYTKDNSSVKYRLDLQNFNGNPYGFSVYSPQQIILKAQKNYLMGLKSIRLFEEDFVYDKIVKKGIVTDEENRTVANIFVKDISLQYVDMQDLSDTTYYLTISAPKGIAFTDKVSSLNLVGRLIYNGEDIMDSKKCVCQWYERDLSVVVGSDEYSKSAGFGWRKIAGQTSNSLTLDATDILYQQKYKLVVVYNDSITLTAEIAIWNRNASYDYSIEQVTDGADIKLQIRNNADSESLVGDWYLSYPDDSYSSVPEGEKKSEIVVSSYLQYSSVTFYCMVYNSAGQFIGTLEHTIVNSESEDDVTISYIGEDSFRYDANGDIAIEDAEKERTLQVVLTWKDGVGTSYKVEWIGPDGKDITNSRYNPSESMIENLWVDNSNILHYTIKQKYKVNFNNNTILVRIITMDKQEYSFRKEILFLKDGDQGTNGTTYVSAIRPFDPDTGLKLSGLTPLVYRDESWVNELPIRCYVYKDGELINNNGNYTLSYKWTGVNIELREGENDDRKIASGTTQLISNPAGGYVKVQVTINDNKNNRAYEIYCNYPIDVAVNFSDDELNNIDISSIPSYIKYTASGVNPSFYSNNIEFIVNNQDYSRNISSLVKEILTVEEKDNLYYLEPVSSFIFEDNSIALLKCEYEGKYIYHPVILYLDTYGNELINGWDGTQLQIDEENGQYILAPQIGAGEKDSFNRFTGVVMGKDSGQDKVGLYGYQEGVNTFGLMEDGTAFFGASSGGGRIKINGKSGSIKGGGGGNNSTGMTINFADLNPGNNTTAIKIGGGVFEVTYNGALKATSATIEGQIFAQSGKIGCTSRNSNDGWTIEKNKLYSGSGATRVELNSDKDEEFAIWAGATSSTSARDSYFAVSKKGSLYAKQGNIGGWILKSKSLSSNNNKIGMASSGSYVFWSGANTGNPGDTPDFSNSGTYFYVTNGGKLSCKNAEVRGNITADSLECDNGEIGGWTISSNSLRGGSTYLYSSGRIVCDDLNCDGGNIGGWTIGEDSISASGTILQSNGNIYTRLGRIGLVEGEDSQGTTYNFGMQATGGNGSVIIQATYGNGNVALRAANYIILNGNRLTCTVPAANQSGIYARFA